MIFNDGLVYHLEQGERCETDAGYRGSAPQYVKLPTAVEVNAERAAIQQRVRNRQERSISGSRIGPYLLSHIATSCSITKLCSVPLLILLSSRLQKILCSK